MTGPMFIRVRSGAVLAPLPFAHCAYGSSNTQTDELRTAGNEMSGTRAGNVAACEPP
jgi:hypothetical protein